MRNNQMPKDFKKIISDPMNQNEILLVCARRLLRCDLVSSFEVDPNNPGMVRPVYDIISEYT